MNYVGFFGLLLPFEISLVVTAVYLVRRRTMVAEGRSWLQLLWRVVLLMVVVNALAMFPVVGLAAVVIWLVALKRLTGLDVLGTVLFSSTLGVICFAPMIILARYFQVSIAGQQVGG